MDTTQYTKGRRDEEMIVLGTYTENEKFARIVADKLPTDAERQAAYALIDAKVRERLRIPANRYYVQIANGNLILDTRRERPKVVNKISKSNQPPRPASPDWQVDRANENEISPL